MKQKKKYRTVAFIINKHSEYMWTNVSYCIYTYVHYLIYRIARSRYMAPRLCYIMNHTMHWIY